MIVFKNYFKVVRALIPTILVLMGIFVGISALMIGASDGDGFTPTVMRTGVRNLDESELSRVFVEYVEATSEVVEVGEEDEEVMDMLFGRIVDFVMVIPEGFGEEFLAGGDVGIETMWIPDSARGSFAEMKYARFWNVARVYAEVGMSEEEIAVRILGDLDGAAEVRILDARKERLMAAQAFFGFANYPILATLILAVGFIMLTFNRKMIKWRNTVSAMSHRRFAGEIFLGHVVLMILVWAAYAALGVWFFGDVMWSQEGILLMANMFIMCLSVLGLAFLIGVLVTNKDALNGIVNILALGTSFISGAFVPQAMLGGFVLGIARFFPSYWYIRNSMEIVEGAELGAILGNWAVILGFGVLFLVAASVAMKRRVKS